MATRQTKRVVGDEEATLPQMPPPGHQGLGAGLDAGFVWQQLSEIQKCLGAIEATQKQHTALIEKLDDKLGGKISKIESDVSEFKQIRHTAKVVAWIVGLAAASVLGVAGFIAKEAWTVLKPLASKAVQSQPPSSPGPQNPKP